MKIAIVCAVYKRPLLTAIFLKYYAQLKDKYNIVLIAVGSEGDISKNLCEAYQWHYVEHPNNPLSCKINRAFLEAKRFDVDAVIWIGSDDFISEGLLDHYFKNFSATTPAIMGLSDLYFYSVFHDETIYFKYHSDKGYEKSMGTARFCSKLVLEKINYVLVPHPETRGVDFHAMENFKKHGIQEETFTMEQAGGICVDIKTDEVMTSYKMLFDHVCTFHDKSILHKFLPDPMPEIEALRPSLTGIEKLFINGL